jgi:hypothetical protein
MTKLIRAGVIGALATAALMSGPAMASTVFASAGFVPNGETGDYYIAADGQSYMATTFTLTQASEVTGIGGVFTQFGDGGSIFGAILAAPANQSDVTASTLAGLSLAHSIFAPPTDGSDASTALSVLLQAGTYELVFGSGVWGTTGNSGLAIGMDGQANLLRTTDGGATWDAVNDSVRMTVEASPVPLPAGLPLLASGLAAVGAMLRRRNTRVVTESAAG